MIPTGLFGVFIPFISIKNSIRFAKNGVLSEEPELAAIFGGEVAGSGPNELISNLRSRTPFVLPRLRALTTIQDTYISSAGVKDSVWLHFNPVI